MAFIQLLGIIMKNRRILVGIIIILIIVLSAIGFCYWALNNIGGGTHGSIESYPFKISKYELEEIVNNIIANDSTIHRDSTNDYNNTGGNVTLYINNNDKKYQYTFRYFGDETYWSDNLTHSKIFIYYILDNNGSVISEGNDNIADNAELVSVQIALFESKIANKITEEIIANYSTFDNNRIDSLKYR